MRRLLTLLIALMLSALTPTGASAAGQNCSIEVTPASGVSSDVYRVSGSNFPVDPNGSWIEVHLEARHLGEKDLWIFFLFLVPGSTEWYLDINQAAPGEPADPIAPGRYLVVAETELPLVCHAVDQFVVV